MDESGFDFRGVPERREPKQFEPPPWEREAFEELQRRKVTHEVTEAAQDLEQELEGHAVAGSVDTRPPQPVEEVASAPEAKGPSDEQVLELLAGLAAQEPDPRGPATTVTIASAIVLLPIGIVVMLWGVVAFVKAGAAVANAGVARTGAATMVMFGAGFMIAAVWLMYRLMKQRGVL